MWAATVFHGDDRIQRRGAEPRDRLLDLFRHRPEEALSVRSVAIRLLMLVEHKVNVRTREKPLPLLREQQNAYAGGEDALLDLDRQLVRGQRLPPVVRRSPIRETTQEMPSQTQSVQVLHCSINDRPFLRRLRPTSAAEESRQLRPRDRAAVASDALEISPVRGLMHFVGRRWDPDDQAQPGVAVLAKEEFPIEARNNHRLTVLRSGVDDQLLDQVAFVGLDACRNTVITDAQHDGSTLRVGHARKHLGKPGRGTSSFITEQHPAAPEGHFLQL